MMRGQQNIEVGGLFQLLGHWLKDNIHVLGACGRNAADGKVVNRHIIYLVQPCISCPDCSSAL